MTPCLSIWLLSQAPFIHFCIPILLTELYWWIVEWWNRCSFGEFHRSVDRNLVIECGRRVGFHSHRKVWCWAQASKSIITYHKLLLWKWWTIIIMLWVLLFQDAWSATPQVGVVHWAMDKIFRLIVGCWVDCKDREWMFYHGVEFDWGVAQKRRASPGGVG